MSKLSKMIRDFKATQVDKERLAGEVERLQKDKERLAIEAEAQAEAGNVEEYQKKRAASVQASDLQHVREKQLEKLSCLRSEAEAQEAWQEYAADYNRDFEKAWNAYEAKRKDLYNDFVKLVEKQQEMLKLREECGACCGMHPEGLFDNPADRLFPVALLPDKSKRITFLTSLDQADVNYYFASGLAGEAENGLWNAVIRLHVPA